jgi:hypothetical protein
MTLSALGIFSAAGAGGAAPLSDYELIETVTLGSSQASIVFSNLGTYSSTYKHLQIRGAVRGALAATSESFNLRFNGDTGSSYTQHGLVGNGSAVSSFASVSQTSTYPGQITASNSTANAYSGFVLDVLDAYSTSKNKTMRTLLGSASNYNLIILTSGLWINTASLTSITLYAGNENLAAGTRMSIYGIKG